MRGGRSAGGACDTRRLLVAIKLAGAGRRHSRPPFSAHATEIE